MSLWVCAFGNDGFLSTLCFELQGVFPRRKKTHHQYAAGPDGLSLRPLPPLRRLGLGAAPRQDDRAVTSIAPRRPRAAKYVNIVTPAHHQPSLPLLVLPVVVPAFQPLEGLPPYLPDGPHRPRLLARDPLVPYLVLLPLERQLGHLRGVPEADPPGDRALVEDRVVQGGHGRGRRGRVLRGG